MLVYRDDFYLRKKSIHVINDMKVTLQGDRLQEVECPKCPKVGFPSARQKKTRPDEDCNLASLLQFIAIASPGKNALARERSRCDRE